MTDEQRQTLGHVRAYFQQIALTVNEARRKPLERIAHDAMGVAWPTVVSMAGAMDALKAAEVDADQLALMRRGLDPWCSSCGHAVRLHASGVCHADHCPCGSGEHDGG